MRFDIDGNIVETTEDHPFWNDTDKQWQRVDRFDTGDTVLADDGRKIVVRGILNKLDSPRPAYNFTVPAYNLTVAGIHTYYVITGNTSALVHNSDTCLTAGDNFKDHFLRKKALLGSVTGKKYSKLAENGPEFLQDLSDMVNRGDLVFEGYGTLKAGQPAAMIYRGQGLTLVTTRSGEFWTLLKIGEGMDAAIRMLPNTLG
ncbi:hypothetical protein Rhe02_36650 [Rhizocola hellebori]|uniref:Intein C-terminal splicing domain-containing protein n=1 Tax=Rhizocola hellebori TaxID=1392758 RepID=A0A8J3Q7L2_9ACTN|nr:hypothetical protein Rhe02_36650 [Rhizocola hellebori]